MGGKVKKSAIILLSLLTLTSCEPQYILTEKVVVVEKQVIVDRVKVVPYSLNTQLNNMMIVVGVVDEELYNKVLNFFTQETKNSKIAKIILDSAIKYHIPIITAFAMAQWESGYNPTRTNINKTSTDYGLFQLNSKAFSLTKKQMLDPVINADEAMKHMEKLINRFESIDKGLVAFNCGAITVATNRVPWSSVRHLLEINTIKNDLEKRLIMVL